MFQAPRPARLSAPFADSMESRCFPLSKIGPAENTGPGQAACISLVCRSCSLETEGSFALELLITFMSISHRICQAPPGFFPFFLWSLMCAGNTFWKDNTGAV